jgi:hypothetical protein
MKVALPPVTTSSPITDFISVLLTQPDSPTTHRVWPRGRLN